MPVHYGVRCKACETIINLGTCEPEPGKLEFVVTPLDPIKCEKCGGRFLYGSHALVRYLPCPNCGRKWALVEYESPAPEVNSASCSCGILLATSERPHQLGVELIEDVD
jgi:hypothetical protein